MTRTPAPPTARRGAARRTRRDTAAAATPPLETQARAEADADAASPPADLLPPAARPEPSRRRRHDGRRGGWRWIAPLAGVALTAALVAQARAPHEVRDAAGERAQAAPAATAATPRIAAEGRVTTYPGDLVTVGSDLRATVERVLVAEKQVVRRGEPLLALRADDLRAALAEARARVAEAEAELRLADLEVGRAERLVAERVEAEQSADRARRNREVASARLETARAAARRLAAELDKATIQAPIDGTITDRRVEAGEAVEPGQALLTLANLDRLRIEAEVDEFDAGRVALGAPVRVRAEGWAASAWTGVVEEIPDTVTQRRLKPQDPGRPEDTRVLLVKIALPEPTPLKLGQRVEVEIGG